MQLTRPTSGFSLEAHVPSPPGQRFRIPEKGIPASWRERTTKPEGDVGIIGGGPTAVGRPLAVLGVVPGAAAHDAVFTGERAARIAGR